MTNIYVVEDVETGRLSRVEGDGWLFEGEFLVLVTNEQFEPPLQIIHEVARFPRRRFHVQTLWDWVTGEWSYLNETTLHVEAMF